MNRNITKAIAKKFKLWLARRGLAVVAEPVDRIRNVHRAYCPKCRTWHVVYLSGYQENEHFHLPYDETIYT